MTTKHVLLARAIEEAGYSLTLRDYVEDSRTPGFLGQIAGRTDHERREVVIGTARASSREITRRLQHELRHVREPEWDCGSRYDPLGLDDRLSPR